jgi:Flp pilus assembly protein TadB
METTHRKPMGPLPGTPGNAWRSPWFWRVLIAAIVVTFFGTLLSGWRPQVAAVLMSLGFSGVVLALAIFAMASLRSRRPPDERLREAP